MATQVTSSAAQVQELYDKLRITEALYTYCRAVDRVDRELGYSIWHAQAEVDYGDGIYRGSGRGVIDHICNAHLMGIVHSHQLTNVLIELAGDGAASEAYVTSKMRTMVERELKHHLATPGFIPPRLTLDRQDPSYRLFDGSL